METKEEREIRKVLYRLGVNNSYLGFRYMICCVRMVLNEDELRYCVKIPYVDTASFYNTTPECVERDIRTLIDIIWSSGDRELLETVAGSKLSQRPGSKAFIGMLADYVREQL